MKLYKLTDANFRTRNNMLWGENITNTISGEQRLTYPPKLCTAGVLHAYTSPLLAAFMAPVHVDETVRTLWEAEGDVVDTDGTKVGCLELTTIRQIPMPEVTETARIRFAILAAQKVTSNSHWLRWAQRWLDGTDRSASAADGAMQAVKQYREFSSYSYMKPQQDAAYYVAYAASGHSFDPARYYAGTATEVAREAEEKGVTIDFEALARKALVDYKVTVQRAFNAAWQAFIVEKKPPAGEVTAGVMDPNDKYVSCRYLTAEGRKCAIGLCIPDGHPAQRSHKNAGVLGSEFPELTDGTYDDLRNAQTRLHDNLCRVSDDAVVWKFTLEEREAIYREFAAQYKLTIPGEEPDVYKAAYESMTEATT